MSPYIADAEVIAGAITPAEFVRAEKLQWFHTWANAQIRCCSRDGRERRLPHLLPRERRHPLAEHAIWQM